MKRDNRIRSGAGFSVLIIGGLLLFAACAAGPNELTSTDPEAAGFLVGFMAWVDQPDHLCGVLVQRECEHLRGEQQRQLVRLRIHSWRGLRIQRRWWSERCCGRIAAQANQRIDLA